MPLPLTVARCRLSPKKAICPTCPGNSSSCRILPEAEGVGAAADDHLAAQAEGDAEDVSPLPAPVFAQHGHHFPGLAKRTLTFRDRFRVELVQPGEPVRRRCAGENRLLIA